MYNSNDLSIAIKTIAKEKGIKISTMLNDCGLNINTISELKNKSGLSCFSLLKIADYLGVSMDYLMGRTENPEVNK